MDELEVGGGRGGGEGLFYSLSLVFVNCGQYNLNTLLSSASKDFGLLMTVKALLCP